jgi:hypothetical protein
MDIRLCAHGSASFARADAILLNGQNDRNSHPRQEQELSHAGDENPAQDAVSTRT